MNLVFSVHWNHCAGCAITDNKVAEPLFFVGRCDHPDGAWASLLAFDLARCDQAVGLWLALAVHPKQFHRRCESVHEGYLKRIAIRQ